MTERFTDHLRRLGDPIWEAQFRHPFVQGIGAGTLPLEPSPTGCARTTCT